jgi:hypothetical protein
MSRASPALLACGCITILGAIVWWWTTYGEVVSYGYLSWREAGDCLVRNSDICSLAKALCLGSHPRVLNTYWASTFWFGTAVLAGGMLTAQFGKAST